MDREKAKAIMNLFPQCAYQLDKKRAFEKATKLLHGDEFVVTVSLQGRMQFACLACNKEMNNEFAVIQHNVAGAHQKNVDRYFKLHETNVKCIQKYREDSLQYMLATSKVKPIGLQLVEEFRETEKSSFYFKCNLCCSHGFMEAMYNHLNGVRHTEKYIYIRLKHHSNVLDPVKREDLRRIIIDHEGQRIDEIKSIIGIEYFPYPWLEHSCRKKNRYVEWNRLANRAESLKSHQGRAVQTREEPDNDKGDEKKAAPLDELNGSQSVSLKKSVSVQTESNKRETVEDLMMKLAYIVQTVDHPVSTIKTPEEALCNLQVMFHLALNLYEVNNYASRNTVDARKREKQEQHKESLSKILGRMQHRLFPSVLAELAKASRI